MSRRYRHGARSPRRDRVCVKRPFVDEAAAAAALEAMRGAPVRITGQMPIRAYACKTCGWWHLTHWPARMAPGAPSEFDEVG